MKLQLPNTIIKLSKKEEEELKQNNPALLSELFPIGTLFYHIQSNVYFRFVPMGRWIGYCIHTSIGGWFGRDNNRQLQINVSGALKRNIISDPCKTTLANRLNDFLNEGQSERFCLTSLDSTI
jgi:hypothetical protein